MKVNIRKKYREIMLMTGNYAGSDGDNFLRLHAGDVVVVSLAKWKQLKRDFPDKFSLVQRVKP